MSYIPKREQRELRELSRYRKSLIAERARELNRLQKMLEGGNIKLSSVVSDINGKSSRNLLQKNVRGFLRFFSLSTKVLTLIIDKVLSM